MTFGVIKTLEAIRLEINSYYCVFFACATTLRYLSGKWWWWWCEEVLSHLLLMLHVINFLKSLSRGKVFSSECVRRKKKKDKLWDCQFSLSLLVIFYHFFQIFCSRNFFVLFSREMISLEKFNKSYKLIIIFLQMTAWEKILRHHRLYLLMTCKKSFFCSFCSWKLCLEIFRSKKDPLNHHSFLIQPSPRQFSRTHTKVMY